jgi:hypothetical protein
MDNFYASKMDVTEYTTFHSIYVILSENLNFFLNVDTNYIVLYAYYVNHISYFGNEILTLCLCIWILKLDISFRPITI